MLISQNERRAELDLHIEKVHREASRAARGVKSGLVASSAAAGRRRAAITASTMSGGGSRHPEKIAPGVLKPFPGASTAKR